MIWFFFFFMQVCYPFFRVVIVLQKQFICSSLHSLLSLTRSRCQKYPWCEVRHNMSGFFLIDFESFKSFEKCYFTIFVVLHKLTIASKVVQKYIFQKFSLNRVVRVFPTQNISIKLSVIVLVIAPLQDVLSTTETWCRTPRRSSPPPR